MLTTDTPGSEWLQVGRDLHGRHGAGYPPEHRFSAERLEGAVAAAIEELTWRPIVDGGITGPMSPVLMLQEVIEQMQLRPVVAVAYGGCLDYPDGPGPETATYSLVGVEVRSRRTGQHFRLHLLDTGLGAVPMRLDWLHR